MPGRYGPGQPDEGAADSLALRVFLVAGLVLNLAFGVAVLYMVGRAVSCV